MTYLLSDVCHGRTVWFVSRARVFAGSTQPRRTELAAYANVRGHDLDGLQVRYYRQRTQR